MNHLRLIFAFTLAATLASRSLEAGFRKKKYETPITKDTQQPDKVLFDRAVKDIEKGRYEVARITLNTLMNTYDTSEFLAKAKLAIADSWMREGGSHGMAQAEAEYKDFILFYPTLEEAPEAQQKICDIHYRQMEKADRDDKHAYRAEEECRQLLVQWPNSKHATSAEKRLREIQEVLAQKEMVVGEFYNHKGSNPAATNRLQTMSDQYPLFSRADEALWLLADSYTKMGTRFRPQAGAAYQRLVRDYPLSSYAEQAKKRLNELEMQVPEADPVAVARMKYEEENRSKTGKLHDVWTIFSKSPDTTMAAKSGTPAMTILKPGIPASVPVPVTAGAGVTDLGATVLQGQSDLDKKPDARQSSENAAAAAEAKPAADPLPANRTAPVKKEKKKKGSKEQAQ